MSAALSGHWWDGSLLQSLTRTLRGSAQFVPLFLAPEAVFPLWLALSLLLVVNLHRWIRDAPPDAAWLGLLVGAMLLAPKGWLYMGWWLIGPAAVVARQAGFSLPWVLVACVLLVPDGTPLAGQPNRWLTPFIGSMYCWGWLTLYLATRDVAIREQAHRHAEGEVSIAR